MLRYQFHKSPGNIIEEYHSRRASPPLPSQKQYREKNKHISPTEGYTQRLPLYEDTSRARSSHSKDTPKGSDYFNHEDRSNPQIQTYRTRDDRRDSLRSEGCSKWVIKEPTSSIVYRAEDGEVTPQAHADITNSRVNQLKSKPTQILSHQERLR